MDLIGRKLWFMGWWSESEKEDSPEPWEGFHISLHGKEAGDTADNPEEIERILKVSGYRLTLERSKEEK